MSYGRTRAGGIFLRGVRVLGGFVVLAASFGRLIVVPFLLGFSLDEFLLEAVVACKVRNTRFSV